MGKEGVLKKILLIFFTLALALCTVSTYANGVQENRIQKAKELIAQKNYNDAILLLTQVVKEEPDRLDEAQDLLNQIRAARNQYNKDYERLLALLYQENDEEKALQVIAQLESLDKNPNKSTQDQVKEAKRTARLVFNNKKFKDIMQRALVLLNQKQYGQAISLYLTGYTLARDAFDEAGYGNILVNQVDRALTDLKTSAAIFTQNEAALKNLGTQSVALLQGNSLKSMKDLSDWRKRIFFASEVFRAQNALIVKSGAKEDFFLSYSYLLTRGRPETKALEGVVGAIDRLWKENMDQWTGQMRNAVEARFQEGRRLLDASDWDKAATTFESAKSLAQSGLDLTSLWNTQAFFGENGSLNVEFLTALKEVLPVAQYLETRVVLSDQGIKTADFRKEAASWAASNTDRAVIEASRVRATIQKTTFASYATLTAARTRRETLLLRDGWKLIDPAVVLTDWQTLWRAYQQKALSEEISLVDRRGKFDFDRLSGRLTEIQGAMTDIQSLLDGIPRDQNGAKVISKYPFEASKKLQEVLPKRQDLQKDGQTFVSLYDGEAPDVKAGPVLAWPPRGRDLLSRLSQLQARQEQLLKESQDSYGQSQTLKKQGQDFAVQVSTAINGENFTLARNLLNQASTRYSQSLNLQEDLAFRQDSDNQVKRLFDLIRQGENELVIRDVRRFITQGSQFYLTGQFTQAEQVLQRARARWAVTNADPNSEVEYWLRLANFALSVTTGREINPTDPLYNEVQQLINFARKDFEDAKTLLEKDSKSLEAKSLLKRAQTTLGKVLLPFPLNQEARVLNLLIQKSNDPEVFNELYRNNFNAAVQKISYNPQEAYTDLQDLEKIQSDFPGLPKAIDNAMIAAGLKRAPPDPKKLTESKTLTALARRIYESNALAQFPAALAQVNKALEDDPTNAEAQDLKDKLSVATPSNVATMTPTQLNEFNEIVSLFTSGRTLEAKSGLNLFKTKYPALRTEPRVKELERRIQAAG